MSMDNNPDAPVLVLRVFDLAPKGPHKSAQGIALGEYATPCGRKFSTNHEPGKGGTIERRNPREKNR